MAGFRVSAVALEVAGLRQSLLATRAGAFASFEGWVRDYNEGQAVLALTYEAYLPLAEAEGNRVLEEARSQFQIVDAACVHRVGRLELGEMAVWVGVSAGHRDAAFGACRWIIDEIKHRLPIWKREQYARGEAQWLHSIEGGG